MIRLALAAAILTLHLGCARSLGEFCSDSAECGNGTSCIPSGGREIVDGGLGCSETKRLCSKTCSTDADCASLGAGHICVSDCFQGSCLQGSR